MERGDSFPSALNVFSPPVQGTFVLHFRFLPRYIPTLPIEMKKKSPLPTLVKTDYTVSTTRLSLLLFVLDPKMPVRLSLGIPI
ncbi:hypothetical protein KY285_024561 [Solanum tuberosum]|nr:hypothetical protein KY285_024561 [Solanum tuberosum]